MIKLELKYGILIALAGGVWLLGEFFVGLHTEYIEWHPLLTNIALLIPTFGLVWALREKRESQQGHLTFWQGVGTGFIISGISAFCNIGIQYCYHTFINTKYFDTMLQITRQFAEKTAKNKEQIEEVMSQAKSFFNLDSYLSQVAIGTLVLGVLLSMVISGFLRKHQAKEQ